MIPEIAISLKLAKLFNIILNVPGKVLQFIIPPRISLDVHFNIADLPFRLINVII